MSNKKTHEDISRLSFYKAPTTTANGAESWNTEDIRIGCMKRIATATEKMAAKYTDMERDLEWYKKRYSEQMVEISRLTRSNNALRGHLNRIKKNRN